MFRRLAAVVVRHPWMVIAAWVVAAAGVMLAAPGLGEVVVQDQSNFLPADDESVQGLRLGEQKFGQSLDPTAVVVVHRSDGGTLTTADQSLVADVANGIRQARIPRVTGVTTGPQSISPNKKIQMITVALHGVTDDAQVQDGAGEVRSIATDRLHGTDLEALTTGEAPTAADNQAAFDRALTIVAVVTILLIIALLLLMFRSPVAALLPVAAVAIVSQISPGLIAALAKALDFEVDQSLSILLVIVLYGVGTDYVVFLLFRYREHLRQGQQHQEALVAAVVRISEVVVCAAAAIVIAFSALLLATFGGLRSFGPGLAIAVAVMALAAITLIPAIVSIIGPRVFWPSRPQRRPGRAGAFGRIGSLTARRPARVAAASGGLLLALACGALGLQNSYDQASGLPQDTEAARGLDLLETGFPPGALTPTSVYVTSTDGRRLDLAAVEGYADRLRQVPGVAAALPAGADGHLANISTDGLAARIDLLPTAGPLAPQSLDFVGGPLRRTAHAQAPDGTVAYVSGTTGVFVDIRDATTRDLLVIFLVAGALIAAILALLLRSLVAPVYLMLAVLLNYFATLGAAVLVFQQLVGREGLMFMLPTLLYLFVVAIGTDYNILMIARLREEARAGNAPRAAAERAVRHAGPSIGAAGVILAGTFASMTFSGISFLSEMGFAVSIGILLSAFVMATLLVPGLTSLFGHATWWPGHGDLARDPAVPPAAVASPAPVAGRTARDPLAHTDH